MSIKIALVGNPNSGKTTLFNALTGSNQYVGNWPGVTVEKKEGKIKWNKEVILTDLPGVYSLSPYTPEEIVARNYLVDEHPSAIINIVDGTNLERNLYLTTQLLDFGIPMVIAINFMDVVRKRGIKINLDKLGRELGCKVVEISALKGDGIEDVAKEAIRISKGEATFRRNIFSQTVENALRRIQDIISKGYIEENELRWLSVKLFERDEEILSHLDVNEKTKAQIEAIIADVEKKLDDDSDGIIISERYDYVTSIVDKKMPGKEKMSVSDKIDKIVTNRWLAIPIFALVMFSVYLLAIGTIGAWVTDFMNDTLFGEWIVPGVTTLLSRWGIQEWLVGLIADGAIGGVGAVLGFVPQMLILFLLLSLLEDCGYMSRIAFIMDRVFRRFGLSGKSFIPMLIASGCGVPGIMASRTIEQQNDRKITIMTTGFIPCSAKMPIVGFVAGSIFGSGIRGAIVATSAYFIGIGAVICSGIILKKFKAFAGHPSPFVMELPEYHVPAPKNVFKSTFDRGWSFIKRAGTVILLASVLIWIGQNISIESTKNAVVIDSETDEAVEGTHAHAIYGEPQEVLDKDGNPVIDEETGEVVMEAPIIDYEPAQHTGIHFIKEGCPSKSVLEMIGEGLAVLFKPVGFGDSWEASVATILGLVAKEEVVGALGTMSEGGLETAGDEFFNNSWLKGMSFMIFNLLCAPCFAAIGAIKNEMNSKRWTWATLGYMTGLAYAVSLITYQFGMLFKWHVFSFWTVIAIILFVAFFYFLFKPAKFSLLNIFKNLWNKIFKGKKATQA